jgi:S1-C subfamily serine protease
MIPKTLGRTRAATFSVDLPDDSNKGMPTPVGSGFFVSGDGLFATAAHVVMVGEGRDAKVRDDVDKGWLMKESRPGQISPPNMCDHLELKRVDLKNDFALMKVDFAKNSDKAWLHGRTEFPSLLVSVRDLEEGEPVYSFGYPLSIARVSEVPGAMVGTVERCPRVTSAIVASNLEKSRMVMSTDDTRVYVLDKALNYGNSGGPIVAESTGNVHAVCTRFQPFPIRQRHLETSGQEVWIKIPSLYGIAVSLANAEIQGALSELGVPVTNT